MNYIVTGKKTQHQLHAIHVHMKVIAKNVYRIVLSLGTCCGKRQTGHSKVDAIQHIQEFAKYARK